MPTYNKYGFRPSIPDQRDLKLTYHWSPFKKLPPAVDLRSELPKPWQQAELGACTAFATLACWHHVKDKQIREHKDDDTNIFLPSFLFQYYNTRKLEGTIEYDSGATIGKAFKALQKYGACQDQLCPYEIAKFSQEPQREAYRSAEASQLLKYYRLLGNLQSVKSCLADGYIIACGFAVYSSFEDPHGVGKTGVMVLPKQGESLLGGHAVSITGYNDKEQHLIVRNSWSELWGDKGYFYMPYEIFKRPGMISDFYSPRLVE